MANVSATIGSPFPQKKKKTNDCVFFPVKQKTKKKTHKRDAADREDEKTPA